MAGDKAAVKDVVVAVLRGPGGKIKSEVKA